MKFTIGKKVMEKAMAHSIGVIEKKQTVPVLGCVLVEAFAEDGLLTITSTNMDMVIVDKLKCEVEESGAYCVPANLLYDITKKMRSDSKILVEFNQLSNSVSVSCGKTKFDIHYIDKTKFPPISGTSYTVQFCLDVDLLKKSINIAKVAMLQDNSRFHLNGIHMHYERDITGDKLRFVATDLFRIACVNVAVPSEVQNMPPIIISKKTVGEILKLIDGSSANTIDIFVSDSKVLFKLSSNDIKTEFSSRLVHGTFPEYKGALEVSNNKILLVATDELMAAIDRVSTVVMDSTNSIKLNICHDKITLSGISRELGTATEEIDANFSAIDPMEICFNGRFLIEILNCIDTKQARMLLAESFSSTIIEPAENQDQALQFAIMPIEVVKT
jgi:DNA polymerase-3 subunit beta